MKNLNKLQKINPEDVGIEPNKAIQIKQFFQPLLDQMVGLSLEAEDVFKMPLNQAVNPARELRRKYVRVRRGVADIHKQQKAYYLKAGRFIDSWKNLQLEASEDYEKRLLEIEKHEEIENKRKLEENLKNREEILHTFEVENFPPDLGAMPAEIFETYLEGVKVTFKRRKDAEKEKALEEIEQVRLDELVKVRMHLILPLQSYLKKEITNKDLEGLTDDKFESLLDLLKKRETKAVADAAANKAEVESLRIEAEKAALIVKQKEIANKEEVAALKVKAEEEVAALKAEAEKAALVIKQKDAIHQAKLEELAEKDKEDALVESRRKLIDPFKNYLKRYLTRDEFAKYTDEEFQGILKSLEQRRLKADAAQVEASNKAAAIELNFERTERLLKAQEDASNQAANIDIQHDQMLTEGISTFPSLEAMSEDEILNAMRTDIVAVITRFDPITINEIMEAKSFLIESLDPLKKYRYVKRLAGPKGDYSQYKGV